MPNRTFTRLTTLLFFCACVAPTFAEDAKQPELTVLSPRQLQVVQRESRDLGKVLVSGCVKSDCDKIEARFSGKGIAGDLPDQWQNVEYNMAGKSFRGWAKVPAGGWYKVEVRASKGGQALGDVVTIDKVGVGEVFVIAGQSNSTNSGQFKITQSSGMVSSFGGTGWQIADDPQPGVHDKSQGGSPWPAFGDAMYEKYKVPIGIASTGHGGTSTIQWNPNPPQAEGSLFMWSMHRIHQLGPGGFRAMLWHQGESDVGLKTDDYVARLSEIIKASKKEAGWEFPWFVAQVSYHNPEKLKHDTMRDAHKKILDLGVAYEGPDTDTLAGDNRDLDGKGIHFSPKGLKAHGEMWAGKVGVYLDKALAEPSAAK
jgi:hypothetical protein